MSALSHALDEYLRVRRALGYQLEREGRLLAQFLDFLECHGSDSITTALALQWASAPRDASSHWAHNRLRAVRGFAKYLLALDPRTEVPPRELLPAPGSVRITPHIYTEREIGALMSAARSLPGLKRATYATLLGLLAATGMRVGEAIALDRDDFDLREATLIVRGSKFGKSRQVLLHPTTVAALRDYGHERDCTLPPPRSPALLLSLAGTRLLYKNVHYIFLRLVRLAGLVDARPRRPRIHDLRHTFAVNTLMRWYREGANVEARLPALSTYLGHVAPSSTYWYLTATPELLELASRRAQNARESLP